MSGTNYYTPVGQNPNVWVKFTDTNDYIDDCELRDTDVLPTEADIFSKGCILKIKDTGEVYINRAPDADVPLWRKINADIVELASELIDFNTASQYTLTTTLTSGTFQVGETITAGAYFPYISKTGTFDIGGETLAFAYRNNYAGMVGGNFAVGDTVTDTTTLGTAKIVAVDLVNDFFFAYSLDDIGFGIGNTIDNGAGVTATWINYQTGTVPPFAHADLLPVGDDGATLFLENYDGNTVPPTCYAVGLTSNATAFSNAFGFYAGGRTAIIESINGTTLTISNVVPVGDFFTGDQIVGGTSNATARAGVQTPLTSNDQIITLSGGTQFIITSIFIANNTQPFTTAGDVFIYDAPNRTGNLIVQFTQAQLATALDNNTNSYISANTISPGVNYPALSNYTQSKTVGALMYLSIDTQEGSPLEAMVRFNGYITQ